MKGDVFITQCDQYITCRADSQQQMVKVDELQNIK